MNIINTIGPSYIQDVFGFRYFELQLSLSEEFKLPLFLHCRNAAEDLYNILKKYELIGVVHSFDGTIEQATKFIELGYYIGLNGW